MPPQTPSISVIIPVLNEAKQLVHLLPALEQLDDPEVIVVDGGSCDLSADLAATHATRLLTTPPGRARQMNAGARIAHGDILLFLHADTRLPAGWPELVRQTVANRRISAGAFDLTFDDHSPFFRLMGWISSWRSRLTRTPYGDQALFLPRKTFLALGGFPEQPIMEDLAFSRLLKRQGVMAFIGTPVITSSRKWQRFGPIRTILGHWLLTILYYLGFSPERLASLSKLIFAKPRF
ncbi:MAG TPA: TIGR04283 family arsenosugar biosynthesis glycosyltransferase [Geobacterales bacterium]|nr:TIGR04283 family arsenosugar biosynthesis glycosyltransferase [Geobacterales bacterium]